MDTYTVCSRIVSGSAEYLAERTVELADSGLCPHKDLLGLFLFLVYLLLELFFSILSFRQLY